ncbi:MAG: hypothetical protein GF418_16460 [Chitinivibrionales bacterium]|nr:hypothetical protein [Chitinivibrionales bacterium]MBD3397215.1 hypothetical protein [Chitinivibrionales bacterium]
MPAHAGTILAKLLQSIEDLYIQLFSDLAVFPMFRRAVCLSLALSVCASAQPAFDYVTYDTVLLAYIDKSDLVDYAAHKQNRAQLEGFTRRMADLSPATYDAWTELQTIAFLINAYNSLTQVRRKIVVLTRLSPVFPFNLLNYAFGIAKASLSHYILASRAGMQPGTLKYVYFGWLAGSLATLTADERERSPVEWILYAVGLVATDMVTVYVTRPAQRAHHRTISQEANFHENKD